MYKARKHDCKEVRNWYGKHPVSFSSEWNIIYVMHVFPTASKIAGVFFALTDSTHIYIYIFTKWLVVNRQL
jgi:hypothetical protein